MGRELEKRGETIAAGAEGCYRDGAFVGSPGE